jgi:hypothetical protein
MFTNLLHPRQKHDDQQVDKNADLKAKLRKFGEIGRNPVREQIVELRARRDAGGLTEAEFAVTVAKLLGTVDAATNYPNGTLLNRRFSAT